MTDGRRTFVPGHKNDVFVSYAHVDDEPLSGASRGWVTTLVGNLETVVRQKLGFKEFEIWMDHDLAGNQPLTPALLDSIGGVATLIVIMSPGYLASEWCRRERDAFLKLVEGKVGRGPGVFVVHYDKIDRRAIPPELGDLIGYPFWVEDRDGKAPRTLGIPVPTPAETEYYSRINQLAHELSRELHRQKSARATAAPEGATVFLAEVTDDLDVRREDVRRYLSQAGLDILPRTYYPHEDAAAFEHAMTADLERCKLFVQLLSGLAGRKSPTAPHGFPRLQYEVAAGKNIPLLQWHSGDLDLGGVDDPQQRGLLEGETVRACGIEEFKLAVVQEAKREPPAKTPHVAANVLVFVNSDSPDRKLAEYVAKLLLQEGIASYMPLETGSPEEIRADLEENLLTCDGLLLVYGETTASWVRSQLRQGRKIISRREQPLAALAVCEGPPPQKGGLDLMLPGLIHLDCCAGLSPSAVREFVDKLRG